MRAQISLEYTIVLAIVLALVLALTLPALSGGERSVALAALRAAGGELALRGLHLASIHVIDGPNVTLVPRIYNASGVRVVDAGIAALLARRARDAVAPTAGIVGNCFAAMHATYCINLSA